MRALAPLLVVAALASGCASLADELPPEPRTTVPAVEQVDAIVDQAARVEIPTLARDSAERKAKRIALRVRNTGCAGVGTGSGFALTRDVFVTNRHVLAGADHLELSTWDGRSQHVEVALVAAAGDIGIAQSDGRLPGVATLGEDAAAGAEVTVVGYPLGGELTLATGIVIDEVPGERFGVPGPVLRLSATVLPGNSGGPVLDSRGQVVAVVFAIENATGLGLAIPNKTVQSILEAGGYQEVPPCGYE